MKNLDNSNLQSIQGGCLKPLFKSPYLEGGEPTVVTCFWQPLETEVPTKQPWTRISR